MKIRENITQCIELLVDTVTPTHTIVTFGSHKGFTAINTLHFRHVCGHLQLLLVLNHITTDLVIIHDQNFHWFMFKRIGQD